MVLNEALSVLSWHENLPKDEIPPRHIWWSAERIDQWFKDVQEKRDRQTGGKRKRSTFDEADDAPMMSNALVNRDDLIPTNGRQLPL